ncbi:TOMM precursor leader peptide-binding protein [Amycolatopsis sp. NPDC054798]
MTEPVLRFRANCRPSVVEGDAVYLHAEAAPVVRLTGQLAARLADEVGTGRAKADVLDRLSGDFGEQPVLDALDKLVKAGFLVEADLDEDSFAAGYWESAGLSAATVAETLLANPVEVRAAGEIDARQFVSAAERLGLRITTSDAALTVLLTDDYLRPEVGEFNAEAVRDKRPWFLCRPIGTTLWLGPRYSPGSSACHACLTSRLSRKDPVASYLRANGVPGDSSLGATAWLPAAAEIGFRLAAIEVARWIAGIGNGPAESPPEQAIEVRTLDTLDLRVRRHRLEPRPQCPVCGTPSRQTRRAARPVRLSSASEAANPAESPEEFVARNKHLVSPVTGIVNRLERVVAEDGAQVYLADQNFAMPMSSRADLQTALRSISTGKGRTRGEAKASALGEAIERYSGMFHGDEPRVMASFEELDEQAIDPNDVHLYSERQIVRRAEHNARGIRSQAVDEPLDPLARLEWTPVWSMTRGCRRYLPTSILYYGYDGGRLYRGHANSNGCAAGATLADAVLRGFFELVERDAVAVWWYNRVRRPAVDLDSFQEPGFSRWRAVHEARGRRVAVLDLTNDLEVPVMAAVSWRGDSRSEIAMGFGAHFDIRTALERAMSESNQFLHAAAPIRPGGSRPVGDPLQEEWLRSATLRTESHLVPAPGPARTAAEFPAPGSSDVLDQVRRAQRVVEKQGLEMLVLDQTRLDVGVPVARVVVPGLRHFWPRFAPGRLYDVPVKLGWLDARTPERRLNPQPMFL